jgi:hypothetical protein
MKSHTAYLTFNTKKRKDIIPITLAPAAFFALKIP